MSTRRPLDQFGWTGGFDSSLQPLDPRMQGKMAEGSFNVQTIDNGRNVPFQGLNASGNGSRILANIGNTWGGIKDITVANKTFTSGGVSVTAGTITITNHGYVTGLSFTFSTGGTLPTPFTATTPTYYLIVLDVNTLQIAANYTDALAGIFIPITGVGAGTSTINVTSVTVTASGSIFQDIGASIWGIGAGQPHIEGTDLSRMQLSSLLKILLAVNGTYTTSASGAFVAGLSQPSAPTVSVLSTPGPGFVGLIDGAVSFKLARVRLSTGARSIASLTSSVLVPAKKTILMTFPLASTGQDTWHMFATQQGYGGVGIHYQLGYNGTLDIAESFIASSTAGGVQASGTLTVNSNPADGDTIVVNGVSFTFKSTVVAGTILIGATVSDTAAAIASVLGNSVNPAITVASYQVSGPIVTLTYDTESTAGNTYTLADSSGGNVTRSATTLLGGQDGVTRSIEIDYRDADLLPIEAYIDDYPPPAGTQAARCESSMVVFGCYSDSESSPSSSSPGTCAAVSLPNFPESYKPRHILFFPEPIVGTLTRLIDSFCYVLCRNSIHAVQFVGWRGDLPSCTVTTVSPDLGVSKQCNATLAYGRLFLWTERSGAVAMNGDGSLDYEFGAAIRKYTKDWDDSTVVGFDPRTRSITYANGNVMFLYCLQSGCWSSAIYLSDMAAGNAEASVTTRGYQYLSLNNSGTHTAYQTNTGGTSLPVLFTSNFSECGTKRGKNIYELLVAGEFSKAGLLFLALHNNFRGRVYRDATTTATSQTIGSTTAVFTNADNGREVFLFGAGIGSRTFLPAAVNTGVDTITITAHGQPTGAPVTFTTSGGLPGGISAGVTYYILPSDANTFQLYTNPNDPSTILNITSQGTGTHTCVINYLAGLLVYSSTTQFTLQTLAGSALTASATLTGVTLVIADQIFIQSITNTGSQDQYSVYPQLNDARQVSVSAYFLTDGQTGQIYNAELMGVVDDISELNIG